MPVVKQACAAGLKAFQLREKDWPTRQLFETARRLKKITDSTQTKLFINDRVDLAAAVGAAGVHLTSASLPVAVVRKIAAAPKLIGVSTHSLAQAQQAEAAGADFILFGPVFDTPSKRQYGPPQGLGALEEITKSVRLPVFAVGGVTPQRAEWCRAAGAWGAAVISAIMAADNVREKVLEFGNALGSL